MPAHAQNARKITDALEEHWDALYRYALIHVRDEEVAEDLVQETLLAAIQSAASFRGEASPRTWLISILKHKIIDHVRKATRHAAVQLAPDDVLDDDGGRFFDAQGRWNDDARPGTWPDLHQALEDARFWEAFQGCCDCLPRQTAQVFMLREVMGLSIDDICKNLGISESNCWVIVHRARLRLRGCLERKWFAG